LGIEPYAASRIRRCRNRNASSPGKSVVSGADELLAYEAGELCVEHGPELGRYELDDGASMKELTLDGGVPDDDPLLVRKEIEASL
jgi:hypothetical protein